MSFDPDASKQAQEVIFSRQTKKINHSTLTFSKSTVSQTTSLKHFGVILDSSLSSNEHSISVQSKTNKTIGLLCKLQNTLVREALITIYTVFARPHLDYGDILYDQAYIISSKTRKNTIQCLYSNNRSYLWYLERKNMSRTGLRIHLKVDVGLGNYVPFLKNKSPDYLFRIIPPRSSYITRNSHEIPLVKTKHNFYKNFVSPKYCY